MSSGPDASLATAGGDAADLAIARDQLLAGGVRNRRLDSAGGLRIDADGGCGLLVGDRGNWPGRL